MRSSALPIEDTTSRRASVTLLRLARLLNFMKSLLDRQMALPLPRPVPAGTVLDSSRPMDASLVLLQGFLHDGGIRGLSPQGRVFDHIVDQDLARMFLGGVSRIPLCGTRISDQGQ